MPELPEVETVCRGLRKKLKSQRLEKCVLNRKNLRFEIPQNLPNLVKNQHLESITRRSKYVLLNLQNGQTLIIHLGMSGRLIFTPLLSATTKHDHVEFHFSKEKLVFNDPRRFGVVDICPTANLPHHKLLAFLGPEPLEEDFSPTYLKAKCAGKKAAIKNVVMDSKTVVGVGNIYANEALFDAGILPTRAAGSLKKKEIEKLTTAIKETLHRAIAAGGSSLNDYVQTDGSLGYFQHQFKVYGREKAPCTVCKAPLQKSVIGQRSSFFCPNCQV